MTKFKKSYEVYDQNLLIFRWLADFIGLDMVPDDYRFNYRTGLCFFALSSSFFCGLYTVANYYPDYYKMCEAVYPLCIVVQGAAKCYYGYVDRHYYHAQYEKLRNLHYKHRNHDKNHANLLWLMEKIHLVSKLIAGAFVVAGFLSAIYPFFMYFVYGKKVLMLALTLPWIDETSSVGFCITQGMQMFLELLGITGFAASEVATLLFVASLIGFVDVFTTDLEDLNLELNKKNRDEKLIQRKVRSICVQHQEIIEYESALDERYFTIYFIQIGTGVTAITIMLFLTYMTRFFPGYIILLLCFSQLFESCLLGMILTVKNEEIIGAIYRTQWYLMKKPEQKCFALMLHKSQHFVELTIGGFASLNLESFVAIMNKIYSYMMMLVNFIG